MALKSSPSSSSPLSNPAIREFLDGLAVLIACRILEGMKGKGVEYAAKPRSGETKC